MPGSASLQRASKGNAVVQIDWEKVLDIGLPALDEQHGRLIALCNGLIHAMILGKGEETLTTVFNKLKDYTVYHFTDEERYMEEIGYPHLEEHRYLHKVLTKKVNEFRDRLLYSKVTQEEALAFLNSWIVMHINDADTRIGEYARTHPAPAEPTSQE